MTGSKRGIMILYEEVRSNREESEGNARCAKDNATRTRCTVCTVDGFRVEVGLYHG